ncbi:unnamed protein product, partial [marine sediment metagenome]
GGEVGMTSHASALGFASPFLYPVNIKLTYQ